MFSHILNFITKEYVLTRYNLYIYVFRKKILCDVIIVTDDGVHIMAHKIVLSVVSPVFYKMFTNFNPENVKYVKLKDIDSDILKMLVEYAYTGKIDITVDNIDVNYTLYLWSFIEKVTKGQKLDFAW